MWGPQPHPPALSSCRHASAIRDGVNQPTQPRRRRLSEHRFRRTARLTLRPRYRTREPLTIALTLTEQLQQRRLTLSPVTPGHRQHRTRLHPRSTHTIRELHRPPIPLQRVLDYLREFNIVGITFPVPPPFTEIFSTTGWQGSRGWFGWPSPTVPLLAVAAGGRVRGRPAAGPERSSSVRGRRSLLRELANLRGAYARASSASVSCRTWRCPSLSSASRSRTASRPPCVSTVSIWSA